MTKDELAHGNVSTLLEMCLETSLRFFESSNCQLNVFVPEYVCEALIDKKLKEGRCDDNFLCSISSPRTSRMFRARLCGASITDYALEVICDGHPLRDVDISNCHKLSHRAITHLGKCQSTLVSLSLANCHQFSSLKGLDQLTNLKNLDLTNTYTVHHEFEMLSRLVNLKRLNLTGTKIERLEPASNLKNLTSLDLSECRQVTSIKALETIRGTLCWLSLYNCTALFTSAAIGNTLEQLTQLQHLDLSKERGDFFEGFFETVVSVVDGQVLDKLATLPHLTSLDLSGNDQLVVKDIMSFHVRQQKLGFLGLCLTDLCQYHNLPADEVTGDDNLKQIVLSLKVYKSRPKFLTTIMRELFNIIRERDPSLEVSNICDLVLCTMENHQKDHKIQLAGSASLYHLSREEEFHDNNTWVLSQDLKRRIVNVTLNAMETHMSERQLQKNCCLTLANFRIPQEVAYDYKRIARVLLTTATQHKVDFVQRIAIGLCNLLVCQVQDSQKVTVGRDLRGVEIILNIIRYKLNNRPETGGVLECCWSALWNVTDETPESSSLFIYYGGLELFIECKTRLGHQRDLVRNMLGLMGNVAEVATLRPYLMDHVHIFYDLLLVEDELEVTYNAGGIISHLAFDGEQAWTNQSVSRQQALQRLVETIDKWDITARRQMSYRSFTPILALIADCNTPAVHMWATWALANLCNVDADKYCKLLMDEGGVQLLESLSRGPETLAKVKDLALMTLNRCMQQVGDVDTPH